MTIKSLAAPLGALLVRAVVVGSLVLSAWGSAQASSCPAGCTTCDAVTGGCTTCSAYHWLTGAPAVTGTACVTTCGSYVKSAPAAADYSTAACIARCPAGYQAAPNQICAPCAPGTCTTNEPPVASAGPDQSVQLGTRVTLDGTGSMDPDNNVPLVLAWTMTARPEGSLAALDDAAALRPSFLVDKVGDYRISLTVRDALGAASEPASALVSTYNTPPVAEAGADQAVIVPGTVVSLDGTQSFDLEGDAFTYAWTLTQKPAGSEAQLSDPASPTPTFVADVHGDYAVALVVTDALGAGSAPDVVTVSFTNLAPVASAGVNQTVRLGGEAMLDGSASWDPNGDSLSYAWSLVVAPQGSGAAPRAPSAARTSFAPDLPGEYVFQLVVSDGYVTSSAATVSVVAVDRDAALLALLRGAVDAVNGLGNGAFRNVNLRNALTNKLGAVLSLVQQGRTAEALDKLEHDLLPKCDGCARAGAPEGDDWLRTCEGQGAVHPLLVGAAAEAAKR